MADGGLEDFDGSVLCKYQEMQAKNEYLLRCFSDFPVSETVIQNYRCNWQMGELSMGGKLWLTQNYLLFTSGSETMMKQYPYMEIKDVTSQTGFWGFTSSISLLLETGSTITLSSFYHYSEALLLIQYLMDHSPCYYHIPSTPSEAVLDKSTPTTTTTEQAGERWSSLSSNSESNSQKEVAPDIRLADECLELAESIFAVGAQNRMTVQENGDGVDRIGRHTVDPRYSTKKPQQGIDAIGSAGGQMKNGGKNYAPSGAHDRDDGPQEVESFYDIPILIKHSNCELEACILRFGERDFGCYLYPEKSQGGKLGLMRDYKYSYHLVCSVCVRVRPQHIDIRYEILNNLS
jgi:hypothetical protein